VWQEINMLPLFQAEQFKTHFGTAALDLKLPALKVISYSGFTHGNAESSSLEPVIKQLQAKVSWFALTGDPEPSDHGSTIAFYRPQATPSVLEQHAHFCANYLSPLLHEMPDRANFDMSQWKSFRTLSEIVASECLSVATESFPTLCWVHDYHLPFVAPTLSVHAGLVLSHFWHSPWPSPQTMIDSPIGPDLVEALLANRLIGFQTSEYASNFLNTVQEMIPKAVVDVLKMQIKLGRTTTEVVSEPFGIDYKVWQDTARHSRPLAHVIARKYKHYGPLVLGIDRLDPTKGVLEKLSGLKEFLSNSPGWRKRFQYVQITYKSDGVASTTYQSQVENAIAEINAAYTVDGWQPIIPLQISLQKAELSAWYQAADILAVNSLRDGLSLVSKEYIACRQDDHGVLLLSKYSGSAPELGQGAILVDPTASKDFADALLKALTLSKGENRRRLLAMRRVVGRNNLEDWAVSFLRQALAVQSH
jgi:trehalose-6-phosphate synthase